MAMANDEQSFVPEEDALPEPAGPAPQLVLQAPNAFDGISTLALTAEEQQALAQAVGDDELDILPSGEVYPTQMTIRTKLNQIFGPGAWALMPRGPFVMCGDALTREYALFVRGHYIGEATGEKLVSDGNKRQNYGNACESVKSIALKRCCKDLGLASQCWDKRAMEAWKRAYAVQVQVKQRDGSVKRMWRRLDAEPFPYEQQGSGRNPSLDPQRKSESQAAHQQPATAAPQAAPAQQPAQAPQAPQQDPQHSANGAQHVRGMIERIYSKEYEGKNGKKKRHGIKIGESWYNSWSDTIEQKAQQAKASGLEIIILFKTSQYGNDIEDLMTVSEATGAAAGNGDPF